MKFENLTIIVFYFKHFLMHCIFFQIYPSDHNSNNFSSAPSTPGSPQAIAGTVQSHIWIIQGSNYYQVKNFMVFSCIMEPVKGFYYMVLM